MADHALQLNSGRPEADVVTATSPAAHHPTETSGRAGASEVAIDRYLEARWTVDIGRRHRELPCRDGSCDGSDDGSICERHQRTGEVIIRYIRLRRLSNARARAAIRARRELERRLERHHRTLPCHRQDDPCHEEHVCFTHADTDGYVERVLERFERLRGSRV